MEVHRGEVFYADLSPVVGSEWNHFYINGSLTIEF